MNCSFFRRVVECARPLAPFRTPGANESGRALPHSKTLTRGQRVRGGSKPIFDHLMNLMFSPKRLLKPVGILLTAFATATAAHAQLTPTWTISHGQAVPAATVRNEYYDNLGFFGMPLVRETPTIDVNWGFQSPDPTIPVDSFTSRHTGRIVPTSTDTYNFFAKVSGGVKMWLDDQLILDFWFEHPESEFVSGACQLKAGSVYNLKVEYFETTGVASTHVYWQGTSTPKQLVRFQNSPDGT